MKPMFERLIEGPLGKRVGRERFVRSTFLVTGRGESHVEEIIQPIYSPWASATPPVETTILASPGQIEVHLTMRSAEPDTATAPRIYASHWPPSAVHVPMDPLLGGR